MWLKTPKGSLINLAHVERIYWRETLEVVFDFSFASPADSEFTTSMSHPVGTALIDAIFRALDLQHRTFDVQAWLAERQATKAGDS